MVEDTRLKRWHTMVAGKNDSILDEILADDIEFHSPFVWNPKHGKAAAKFILMNVIDVFQDFAYHREWIDGDNLALEFSANVDGKFLKGVDLIHWPVGGQIENFEVIIRPANALMAVGKHMSARLEKAGLA